MAKKAQIKGVSEDVPTKVKRWLKSEYINEDKFSSNLVWSPNPLILQSVLKLYSGLSQVIISIWA